MVLLNGNCQLTQSIPEPEPETAYSYVFNIGVSLHNSAGCVTNIGYSGSGYSKNIGLTWNSQYQLTAVSTNGSECERNGYDALGRRVWNWNGSETNYFVYDGQQIIADVDSTGGLRRAYVWGPGIDNLLAMTVYTGATAKTYFALTDHLRSVHAMVDESGTIVEQYRMDAWGRTTVYDGNGVSLTQSAIGNRYVWQGREISWVTGLYHFRLRTYDPVTGRFLSNDPIGIAGGLNQYVFCGNNPVNFRDPFGLCEDATLELDYDMAFRANQYDWYYLAMVHFSMDNQRFDPGGAGEVARNRLIPWAGGYARGDQWGNRQAGRELTGAYGGVVALLMLEVMGPVYANNCISLDETAGSLEDNIIGIGQAFREHPVHSTAMSIGITSVVLAIPSAVVNQVSDRLGNWWGSR